MGYALSKHLVCILKRIKLLCPEDWNSRTVVASRYESKCPSSGTLFAVHFHKSYPLSTAIAPGYIHSWGNYASDRLNNLYKARQLELKPRIFGTKYIVFVGVHAAA